MLKLEPRPQPSQFWSLASPLLALAITVIIGVAVFFAQYFQLENQRKATALKLSHDEVRRLAALACLAALRAGPSRRRVATLPHPV